MRDEDNIFKIKKKWSGGRTTDAKGQLKASLPLSRLNSAGGTGGASAGLKKGTRITGGV